MSATYSEPQPSGTTTRRTNRQVWLSVVFALAGLIPFVGFMLGLTACVCAAFVLFGRGYSARQRLAAGVAFVLGAALAALWLWASTWNLF